MSVAVESAVELSAAGGIGRADAVEGFVILHVDVGRHLVIRAGEGDTALAGHLAKRQHIGLVGDEPW